LVTFVSLWQRLALAFGLAPLARAGDRMSLPDSNPSKRREETSAGACPRGHPGLLPRNPGSPVDEPSARPPAAALSDCNPSKRSDKRTTTARPEGRASKAASGGSLSGFPHSSLPHRAPQTSEGLWAARVIQRRRDAQFTSTVDQLVVGSGLFAKFSVRHLNLLRKWNPDRNTIAPPWIEEQPPIRGVVA
jgi:hypothetical protein